MKNIILIATATCTALSAGVFFAWSVSVTNGLARLSDAGYIAAFQAMNRAIQNPVFFLAFMGAALLLPLSTYLTYQAPPGVRFWLMLAATIFYLAGVMGVTMAGNVPMNDALDTFNLNSASAGEIASRRAEFESLWNSLNTVRTVTSFLSLVLVIIALLCPPGKLAAVGK